MLTDPTGSGNSAAFAVQDLNTIKASIDAIGLSSDKVSKSLTSAFTGAITSGKSFDQTLQGILASLAKMVLSAGTSQVTSGLNSLISTAFSGLGSANTVTP